MKIGLDEESQQILEKLTKQLDRFNESVEDFRTMIAPLLGFRIKKKKEGK